MSSLTDVEKRYLERVLAMNKGYVLDYKDATFGLFFRRFGIDIHSEKYQTYGSSKANKMRSFWEREPDILVGRVLGEMLDGYEADCALNNREVETVALGKSREIVQRLSGHLTPKRPVETEADFLSREFSIPNIQRLPIEGQAVPVIENRLAEARTAMNAGAYLSTIFLCGSVLEAVLLGAAQQNPALFNRAAASPKAKDGSVKRFHDWSLAQLIDVASEVGVLKPDVKKFSHGLRDFRNYIHPFEQMLSGFMPDEHTARVCLQVLKAALASVAGERK